MAIPPTEDNIAADFAFDARYLRKRDMSWMDTYWMTRGTIKFTANVKPYGYAIFNNGTQELVELKTYTPLAPRDNLVKEDVLLNLSVVTNDGSAPYRYSDFLFHQTLVEPETAESILASTDIQHSRSIEVNPEQDSLAEVERVDPALEQ